MYYNNFYRLLLSTFTEQSFAYLVRSKLHQGNRIYFQVSV